LADAASSAAAALSRFQSGLGNEYLWSRCIPNWTYTETERTSGNQNTLIFHGSREYATVRVSNSLQEALRGVYTEQNVTPEDRETLNGKYVRTNTVLYSNQPSEYANIFYIAPDATWSIYTNPNGYCFSKGTVYSRFKESHIHQSYVNSADPNAYPYADGDYINVPIGRIGDGTETVGYVGTGLESNTITFNCPPKVVIFFSGASLVTTNSSVGFLLINVSYAGEGKKYVASGYSNTCQVFAEMLDEGKTIHLSIEEYSGSGYQTSHGIRSVANLSGQEYTCVGFF